MNKLNKFISLNFNKIITFILIFNPIIDLLNSIFINNLHLNFTFGVVVRIIFLLFFIYCLLNLKETNKKNKILIFIIGLYLLMFLGLEYFNDSTIIFIQELKMSLKTFYFPICLLTLYTFKDRMKNFEQLLVISMFEYIILIFIPLILHVGLKSYEITKVGSSGFFMSANEVSCIIGIITPLFIYFILNNKKNIFFKVLSIILYLYVIVTIGTKVPLLSLFITLVLFALWYFIKLIKKKDFIKLFCLLLVSIVFISSSFIIIPKTNFYKNIKIHMNYLHIKNVSDVVDNPEIIDHFIFSQRVKFYRDNNNIYKKVSPSQKIFGMGYIRGPKNKTKLVEMDYYDIFYSHGILGFIIYFYIVIDILIKVLKNLKNNMSFKKYSKIITLILIFVLTLFSGHVMTAPSVSLYVSLIFISLCSKKKNLLFTAYDLNVGGIETALINLLKRINYDKYNVTLILEKKEGVLLKEIDSRVNVIEYKVSNSNNVIIRKSFNLMKRIIYVILNKNTFDFSCCYATYSMMGAKVSRISSDNNSIYIHGNYVNVYPNNDEFLDFFNKRKINEFKKIFFVSKESMQDFLSKFPNLESKCVVVNNFVDEEKIKKLATKKINIKRTKTILFVLVGRLDESSKRITRALEVMKNLKKDFSVELWIVGDGPDKKIYQDYIIKNKLEENVKLLGMQKNPFPYMKEADYILLTSEYEGFPVTYMEAAVLNKKIVTTIDVSDQFIKIPKKLGFIISKDTKKMQKQIKEIILDNKFKYQKLDMKQMNSEKMKMLEEIFDEVV